MPYTKNLQGVCEADDYGSYYSAVECEAGNQVWFAEDFDRHIAMQAVLHDPEKIFHLAPSDRVRAMFNLYGIRVSPEESYSLAEDIYTQDWFRLFYHYPEVSQPYWSQHLDDYDLLLLRILQPVNAIVADQMKPIGLRWLRRNLDKRIKDLMADEEELIPEDYLDALVDTLDLRVTAAYRNEMRHLIQEAWPQIQDRY